MNIWHAIDDLNDPSLDARLAAEHGSRTLLHPSEPPPPDTLLRSAGTTDQDTEILLRMPEQ